MAVSDFRFPSRVQKLRERLAKDDLDALFLSNGENRRYISGFMSSAGYLLVTQDEAVVCTDFRYTEMAAQQAPGWRVDRIGGKPDWLPKLVNELEIKTLGFEADDMTVATLERFKKALKEGDAGPELKPTTGIGVDLRAYKDPEELELLQRAIDIVQQDVSHINTIIAEVNQETVPNAAELASWQAALAVAETELAARQEELEPKIRELQTFRNQF